MDSKNPPHTYRIQNKWLRGQWPWDGSKIGQIGEGECVLATHQHLLLKSCVCANTKHALFT